LKVRADTYWSVIQTILLVLVKRSKKSWTPFFKFASYKLDKNLG